jgi:glycosyltransferase involved in cell wall biosynthesis
MNPNSLKIGLQQRVLAGYRLPFFELLGRRFSNGLSLFAGDARANEMVEGAREPDGISLIHAYNLHFFSGKYYLCWQIGITQWLQAWKPDVLILEANPRYLSQRSAINWMHQNKRPVIGWGLGAPPVGGFSSPLVKFFRRRFLSQFDAIVTYSQTGAAGYRAAGIPPHRIFVACNAVTPRPTRPMPERPVSFADNRPTLLFVGRLQARKRVDFLIRSCAALAAQYQPRLVVVGDGPEKENLMAVAAEVYPQTEFKGAIYGADLAAIFQQADLFVLPGTGGLALQEAMSHGLAVVAAEADGTQADLVRLSNGWKISPGSEDALTLTLQEALSDVARLRRMGAESYRIVSEEINLEAMVDVFDQAVQYAANVGRAR